MPPKPGSMQDFVRGKFGDEKQQLPASKVNVDGLKAQIPRTGQTANTRQQRIQHQDVTQRHGQKLQSYGVESTGQKRFYDTDNSSIGDTSETPSVRQIQEPQHAARNRNMHDFANDADLEESQVQLLEDATDPGEEDGEGNEEDDAEELGTKTAQYDPSIWPLNARQRGKMGMEDDEEDGEEEFFRGQVSLPYVEGDSYPSTTSGPPSMIEADGSRSFHAAPEQVTAQMPVQRHGQVTGHNSHQPVGHQQQGRTPQIPRAERHQVRQVHSANTQVDRTLARPQESTRQETGRDFTPGQGLSTRTGNRQPLSHPNPAVPAQNAMNQASAIENARKGYPPYAERTERQSHQVDFSKFNPKPPQRPQGRETAIRPAPRVSVEPEQAGHLPGEKPPHLTAQDDAQMSDSELHDEQRVPFEEELSPETDFDTPELFDMNFSDLKTQPFDIDPREDPTGFRGIAADDPIEKQVETVVGLQSKDQHAFFSSLPIDEWERAGDWFLGKFGETLAKLKKLRQEKRKGARAFEKEIEARHVAVTKKRKLTEDALDDMKKSGNMVLASTPKKAKMG